MKEGGELVMGWGAGREEGVKGRAGGRAEEERTW